jgi:hypothetical protein
MDDPFNLKEANGFPLLSAIVLVGDDEGATIRRILGQFLDIEKRAKEELIALHQSKKLINVTVLFIIKFSLNLSIHI